MWPSLANIAVARRMVSTHRAEFFLRRVGDNDVERMIDSTVGGCCIIRSTGGGIGGFSGQVDDLAFPVGEDVALFALKPLLSSRFRLRVGEPHPE